VPSWATIAKPAFSHFRGPAALLEPPLEQPAKRRVVFDESVDKVIILGQRNQLKGRAAIDSDDHGLLVAPTRISAQVRLGFTLGIDSHAP